MSKKELKKIEEKLLKRKRELLEAIQANLDKSGQSADERPSDLMDIASGSYENEFNVNLAGREAEELAELNEALDKIRDGSYGKCAVCEKPIKAARLRALPFATRCIKCKEAEERERGVGPDGMPTPRWE
jgi:DnaK suppressor protein